MNHMQDSTRPAGRVDWPATVLQACRLIERGEQSGKLDPLAAEVGVSASELQRQFMQKLGVSPRQYSQALKLLRLTRDAGRNPNVLDAVFDAGFESATRAYANSQESLGVSPGKLRTPLEIGFWLASSALGWMLMAATSKGICWLSFGDDPRGMLDELGRSFPKATLHEDEQRLNSWFEQVRDHILLPEASLDLPVDIQGTAFQAAVWNALRKIPLGATCSYSEVAESLGKPAAVRAVASAVARNKVALLIPCHRVIAKDGTMAGYRWGVGRKQQLLERESPGRKSG